MVFDYTCKEKKKRADFKKFRKDHIELVKFFSNYFDKFNFL